LKAPSRPTIAEINLSAIAQNLRGIRRKVGGSVKIMAVVKANAYGHGSLAVSKFIEMKNVADYFGVAFPEEGIELRDSGIRKPIHVFTLAARDQMKLYVDYKLEPTVCTLAHLEEFDLLGRRTRRTISVHLKIDTGMNRIGAQKKTWDQIPGALAKLKRVNVKGVFTHFATSGEQDRSFARAQLSSFHEAIEYFRRSGIEPEEIHCANSGAILDLPDSYFSMVRPGIMMYGYYPSQNTSESIPLQPAMALKTRVALVKRIEAGEFVSYGRRFAATKQTTIATLPIGYADGLFRSLTNNLTVLIEGSRFPVVGTICMDQCMADCGDVKIAAGDEAVLIGSQRGISQSAWALSEPVGTIPYEILCAVSARVPRVYQTS
jgi:alanine racemase